MIKNRTKTKYRLNLDFPAAVEDSLFRLQELSHSASKAEVIRRALSLYDVVFTHQDAGGQIVLRHPDGEMETLKLL